jgi:hypothetical protein
MDITKLASAWSERNDRLRRPTPAEIPGVGTVYLRAILAEEKDYIDEVRKQEDGADTEAIAVSYLLCHEDGTRLTEDQRAIMLPILQSISRGDSNVLWAAAAGRSNKDTDQGN